MNGSTPPLAAPRDDVPDAAGAPSLDMTLAKVHEMATERHAIAAEIVAQARGFEEQLAQGLATVIALIETARAAEVTEREAIRELHLANERLAVIAAAHAALEPEIEAAQRTWADSRDLRIRAEEDVASMQARIEVLSGPFGLRTEAVHRIIERRIADTVRQTTIHGDA